MKGDVHVPMSNPSQVFPTEEGVFKSRPLRYDQLADCRSDRYLLHGRPGAGKTTLGEDSDPGYGISVDPTSATAIASALKLDIYVINPAARG